MTRTWMFALLGLLLVGAAAEESAEDIRYAEHLPLVPDSLLLDVTRSDDGRLVAVGERGHVVWSEDGGVSWTQAEVVPTRSTLTSVTAAGDRLWAAGHDSVILSSSDAGQTWTRRYYDIEREQPIMDILFLDRERGLAIGAYGLLLMTEDGGETWDDHYASDEEWHYNGIVDFGDGRLLMAGEKGFAYRSSDGGATWETIELPYDGSMFGIIRTGSQCVIAYGLRGHAQESCDFGDSWQELATGTENSIAGGAHRDGVTVLVGKSGLVLEHRGEGPWRTHLHSSGGELSGVTALADGRFLIVGEGGTFFYPEPANSGEHG